MTDLGFGVLGPLEAWRGGRRLAVPGGRRRSVLAALLVHAGNPVPADALVEAAWSDSLPADPRAALYTVVSRLRSLLGDDALSVGPAGYRARSRGSWNGRFRSHSSNEPAETARDH